MMLVCVCARGSGGAMMTPRVQMMSGGFSVASLASGRSVRLGQYNS